MDVKKLNPVDNVMIIMSRQQAMAILPHLRYANDELVDDAYMTLKEALTKGGDE